MFDLHSLILIPAGFVLANFAVVFGGTMFFTIPLMQALFPAASFGMIIGNSKVGSLARSIGSTYATHRQIDYKLCLRLAAPAFIGTAIGASLISHMDQKWLFPAVCVAILFAVFAPTMAAHVNRKHFHAIAFATGLYAGVFGAGIGVMLMALLRLVYPDDCQIAFVKIQARFVEFLLLVMAIGTHLFQGNLVPSIWVPWSLGAILGGYSGGHILKRVGNMHGRVQKTLLYISFAVALLFAGLKFLESY